LQLSEDGKSWVPINPKSSGFLSSKSTFKTLKKLPSDISLDQSNVTIVTNTPPSNTATTLFVGGSIFGVILAVLILVITVIAPLIFFALLLWGFLRLLGNDQTFFEFLASFG
jgi:hypothetical protein